VDLDAGTGSTISNILVQPALTSAGIDGLTVDPSGTRVAVEGG
jgi:hypothetical protein